MKIENLNVTGKKLEIMEYFNKLINNSAELYYNTPGNTLSNTTLVIHGDVVNSVPLHLDERVITAYEQISNIEKTGVVKLITGNNKMIEYQICIEE
jgi:hypothetical protein